MARLGARSRANLARILWEEYPALRDSMNPPDTDQYGQRPSGDDGLFLERREGQRRK